MKNLEHILLTHIESLPRLARFNRKIFKDKRHIKSELQESIAILENDAGGQEYLAYLLLVLSIQKIDTQHISHFFALREHRAVSRELQDHYAGLAETVLSIMLSNYAPGRIEHSALYLIADFYIVRRVDFILLAPAIFPLIVNPHDLTPPLLEKLCEILIEHYHIEDIIIFLVTETAYDHREILKIIRALSFGQKLYRRKREKRHRLLDKDKVSRMWFQKPYKTLRSTLINHYKKKAGLSDRNDHEIESLIEKESLEKIRKRFRRHAPVNEKHPTACEKLGLELVLLRNNEDIFIRLIETIPARARLVELCKYFWQYMHLLRVRSLHEGADEEIIHRLTVEHAFEEIKGTTPVILYIEDNGRYQDEFTRHVTFECQSLELLIPKIIVYASVTEFRQKIPDIITQTRDALAHIFVIDGVLADGTWKAVLEEIGGIERSLWQQRQETFYPVKYLFTGDIEIARDAYQAKILQHVPLDGIFIKPPEYWDDIFLEISLRARKTGIQTDDLLYQRIVMIIKEVMA